MDKICWQIKFIVVSSRRLCWVLGYFCGINILINMFSLGTRTGVRVPEQEPTIGVCGDKQEQSDCMSMLGARCVWMDRARLINSFGIDISGRKILKDTRHEIFVFDFLEYYEILSKTKFTMRFPVHIKGHPQLYGRYYYSCILEILCEAYHKILQILKLGIPLWCGTPSTW